MDCPGAFEIVLTAYDQVENATSLEAVQHTLAELICFDPHHEIVEELRWKRTDLIVEHGRALRPMLPRSPQHHLRKQSGQLGLP